MLTLEVVDRNSYFKPLQSTMDDERRVRFTVQDEDERTVLICGFTKIPFKRITQRKWMFLHEIEKAQNSYWGYNKYHRKYSRINVLFYTVTLRCVGTLILDILNEATTVTSAMEYEKIDDQTQHLFFAIKFPDNYLITEKHYRIVQKQYVYNYAEYIATCIEYVGCKPD